MIEIQYSTIKKFLVKYMTENLFFIDFDYKGPGKIVEVSNQELI